MTPRKSLTDILNGGSGNFNNVWDSTEAAGDFEPLPSGWYECWASRGELDESRNGTPGYKLTFTVRGGEFEDRKLWHDLWLTPAALPMTKRDLSRIGITTPEQMEQPLPQGIVCRVQVTLRRGDDSIERNNVRRFEFVGIEKPEPDAFAPDAPEPGEADDSDADGDTSFDPSAF